MRYFELRNILARSRNSSEQSGFSLIEVMITGLLGAIIMLAISNAVLMSGRALRGFSIRQDLISFKDQVKASLDSPQSCLTMMQNNTATLKPGPGPSPAAPQSIILHTAFGTFDDGIISGVPAHAKIGNDLVITSISFTKTVDLLPNALYTSGHSFLDSSGVTNTPITGKIDIVVSNVAVQNGNAFGASIFNFTFPVTLTFTGAADPYTVVACNAILPSSSANQGWYYNTRNNTQLCTSVSADVGEDARCPAGKYVLGFAYVTTPEWTAFCYSPPLCSCSGKGWCFAWCWVTCSPHPNPNADGSFWLEANYCNTNVGGNCAACGVAAVYAPACSGYVQQITTPHLAVTCCSVLR